MSVITRTLSEDGMQLFCKGAPEKIASLCQPDTGKTSALDKKDGLPNLQTIGGGWRGGGWVGGVVVPSSIQIVGPWIQLIQLIYCIQGYYHPLRVHIFHAVIIENILH